MDREESDEVVHQNKPIRVFLIVLNNCRPLGIFGVKKRKPLSISTDMHVIF